MRTFSLLICLFFSYASWAYEGTYATALINASLLKKANVIKRVEEVHFDIRSLKNTTLTYKYALTILNEKGDKHAYFVEWYDKLREISSIEGTLYDAAGKLIKKLKPKEVQDLSGVDNISLMDDNRKKVHSFYHKVYPYTVEYEVQIKYNHTFHFPGWMPQDAEFMAVEKSSYQVTCPADYALRYKLTHSSAPKEITEKGVHYYNWQVVNQPAIVRESYGPAWNEMVTSVNIAPTLFELQGYTGNMTNWTEFGKFIYELGKERTALPAAVKTKIAQIISNAGTDKEKVQLIYEYLQQNTRYISIQLGIGGWQPFDAEYVAKKGYGDCKALSNYMHSLLKEAGIPSYYALINAGKDAPTMVEDFPSSQFNHAILCVPMNKDTLWLECTSQTSPSGYMGSFTGNRKSLLITEKGGIIVNTPRYTINNNVQTRIAKGIINEEGGLATTLVTRYTGLQQDDLHNMIHHLSKEKMKETLQEAFPLATYNVATFNYTELKSEQPQIDEKLQIDASGYATITGKRMFVSPNVFNQSSTNFEAEAARQHDIIIRYEYRDVDSITLQIPAGYEPEALPKDVQLKTEFGSYSSSTKIDGTTITYIRVREQYKGQFPANLFTTWNAYLNSISKADKSKIVLVKKQ